MKKPAKPRAMSPLMSQVLRDIAEGRGGFHGCSGRSEYGGRSGTIVGLRVRGYISNDDALTEAGRAQLAKG
ncbi:hypothetical protein ACI77O_12395 [Pseudomonas tritici]|uniref:hypothetical protein n=1 Tax=Pseudomonas tritici TaxID=2745518 RepID=UPI00387B6BE7